MPDDILSYLPLILVLVLFFFTLTLANWWLIRRHKSMSLDQKLPRQVFLILLLLTGIVAVILVLPVSETIEAQLLGIMGLIVSGLVALSSTDIVSNILAGLLLRFNRPFSVGEMIDVGEYSGRVAERGLFDTEIQTPDGKLISIPNNLLISSPISVIPPVKSIITVELPLGYEEYEIIEPILLKSASEVGLDDPFTRVLELKMEHVLYQVGGSLEDDEKIITKKSSLLRAILNNIRANNLVLLQPTEIEIAKEAMPKPVKTSSQPTQIEQKNVDTVVFSKAEVAVQLDELRKKVGDLTQKLKSSQESERTEIEQQIAENTQRIEALENEIQNDN